MHSTQPTSLVASLPCGASRSSLRAWLLAAASAMGLALALPVAAQSAPFEPQVGQSGKDVIWVPTPNELVNQMLGMAGVTARDTVIDLGSGDGRTVIAAAKLGANAMGIEYDPNMVSLSNANARAAGVAERAHFIKADIFEYDFSGATVLTLYLLTDLNVRLRPKILQMKPGTRVVSHQFRMGDWEPDRTVRYDDRPAYLWIVPARVAGKWRFAMTRGDGKAVDVELELMQNFQVFGGTARIEGRSVQLERTQLRGGYMSFRFTDGQAVHRFQGQVGNGRISGQHASGERNARWRALKVEAVKP